MVCGSFHSFFFSSLFRFRSIFVVWLKTYDFIRAYNGSEQKTKGGTRDRVRTDSAVRFN